MAALSIRNERIALSALSVIFLVRFFLGPLSLAAGTPSGYFTPVLLLGAVTGAAYGTLLGSWLPSADMPPPAAFALAGMAVNLATTARAPFTGILLAVETTGALPMAVPMIIAVCASHDCCRGVGMIDMRDFPLYCREEDLGLKVVSSRGELTGVNYVG